MNNNPHAGERMGKAWNAIVANLAGGEWRARGVTTAIAQQAGGILHKSAHNLISEGIRSGHLEVRTLQGKKPYDQLRLPPATPARP